jgi:hypothetical protein
MLKRSAIALLTLGLAACATTHLDGQWTNPEYAGRHLRGTSVLVACEAAEPTMQRICEDQLWAQVMAAGATPTRNSQLRESATAGPGSGTDPYLAAARRIGARGIIRTTLTAGMPVAYQAGPTIGIGVGGGGGRIGGFGGLTVPVGGTSVNSSYSSETALIDPSNGAIMWSGRATSTTSQDATGQIAELAKAAIGAVKQAGFF